MRLTELNAEWINAKGRSGIGVRFLCPHCKRSTLSVLFLNPLDGGPSIPCDDSIPSSNEKKRWARSGMTLEELTVSPNIELKEHWTGCLTHGEVKCFTLT